MRSASPAPSAPASNVTRSPGLSSATSSSGPIRSLGPGRSWRIATGRSSRSAAARTRWAVRAFSSGVPWEKFSRTTSIPASIIRVSVSTSSEAGPIVATILVRRSTC